MRRGTWKREVRVTVKRGFRFFVRGGGGLGVPVRGGLEYP